MSYIDKIHFFHFDEAYEVPQYAIDHAIPTIDDITVNAFAQICRQPDDDLELFERLMKKWLEIFSRTFTFTHVSVSEDDDFSPDTGEGTYVRFFTSDEFSLFLGKETREIADTSFAHEPWLVDYFTIMYAPIAHPKKRLKLAFSPYKNVGSRFSLEFENNGKTLSAGVMIVQKPGEQTDTGLCFRSVLEEAGYPKVVKPLEKFIEKILVAEKNCSEKTHKENKARAFDALEDF